MATPRQVGALGRVGAAGRRATHTRDASVCWAARTGVGRAGEASVEEVAVRCTRCAAVVVEEPIPLTEGGGTLTGSAERARVAHDGMHAIRLVGHEKTEGMQRGRDLLPLTLLIHRRVADRQTRQRHALRRGHAPVVLLDHPRHPRHIVSGVWARGGEPKRRGVGGRRGAARQGRAA